MAVDDQKSSTRAPLKAQEADADGGSRSRSRSRKGGSISWAEYEGIIKVRAEEKLEDSYNGPRALSRESSRRASRRSSPDVTGSSRSTSPELLPVSRWSSASPTGRSSRANSPSPPTGSSPSRGSLNSPPFASPKGSSSTRGFNSASPSSPGSSAFSPSPSPTDGHASTPDSPGPGLRIRPLLTNTPNCTCVLGDPKCEHAGKSLLRATSFVTLLPEPEAAATPKDALGRMEKHVPLHVVQTPRVPGEEESKGKPKTHTDQSKIPAILDKEALLLKIPGYLLKEHTPAVGSAGMTSPEPQESPFAKNQRFSRASMDFHVPSSVRPRSSVELSNVGTGRPRNSVMDLVMQGAEVRNRSSIDGSLKPASRRESVTIPVNAKQWLLQSIGLKDQQIRAMFDQMEAVPSSAADHVREVRAEWNALESRDQRASPAAEFLLKDQALLQKVKDLLNRFNERPRPHRQHEADGRNEDAGDRKTSFEQAEDLLTSLLTEGHMPISHPPEEGSPTQGDKSRATKTSEDESAVLSPSSPPATMLSSSAGQGPQTRRSVSPGGSIVGRFICQNCGEVNAAATPHSNISRAGPLPKETVPQRTPSLFPTLNIPSSASLPSLIPLDDYVVQKGMFKPDMEYKSAFSPLDKRWYSVLFPALQPGKREDVELLGAWLLHATQRNCPETLDGRFEDVESSFVLHCIAFLEVVRQVRIHCEDRGNLLLHLWRQLLRIFNQVMVMVEPRLTAAEEEVKRTKEQMVAEKTSYDEKYAQLHVLKEKITALELVIKKQAYELEKIHRCRLCLAENMTPRSREELIRRARGKSFSSIVDNKGDVEKEARNAVLDMGYKQIQAQKEAIAEKERAKLEVEREREVQARKESSKKQEASTKKEVDKSPGASTQDDTKELKNSGWQKIKKVLMDALVGGDEELPLSGKPRDDRDQDDSDSSGSVYADVQDQEDGEGSSEDDYDEDEEDGSAEASGGTGESRSIYYSESLDSEAIAELEERIAYLLTLPDACTQTDVDELKGYARRPRSAPGRLETVYPKVKKVLRQGKFDEFAADKDMAPPPDASTAETEALRNELEKYGELAEDTIFLLRKSLPAVDGTLATDIHKLLQRYQNITGKHAADDEDLFRRREHGADILDDGDDGGSDGGYGGRNAGGSKRFSKRYRDGFHSPTSRSRNNSIQLDEKGGKRSNSDTKGLSKTAVPLGFGHLMNIKVSPKNVRYMNVRQLTKLIAQIYNAKIEADIIDDASNLERQTCCEFIYDHMLHQYGLKKLSEAAIHGMFKTIKSLISSKQIEKAHRIRMFSRFVGFDARATYGEKELYVYLKSLAKAQSKVGTIFTTEQEEGESFINCALLHNFTDEPSLVEHCGGSDNTSLLVEKIVAANAVKEKCSPEVRKVVKLNEVRKLDWDLLMESILDTKEQADPQQEGNKKSGKRKSTRMAPPKEKRQELENLFIAGDVSQEGLLTFNDFRDIISAANPGIKSQIATRMYRETLVLMDGGDRISPSAFATIAHGRGIAAPPDVIFHVLKKNWAKVQQRINFNLLKDRDTKAEFEEVRNALVQMIEQRRDLNAAVQIFRAFVIKFCKQGVEAPEALEQVDEEQDEPLFTFDD